MWTGSANAGHSGSRLGESVLLFSRRDACRYQNENECRELYAVLTLPRRLQSGRSGSGIPISTLRSGVACIYRATSLLAAQSKINSLTGRKRGLRILFAPILKQKETPETFSACLSPHVCFPECFLSGISSILFSHGCQRFRVASFVLPGSWRHEKWFMYCEKVGNIDTRN